MTVRELIEELEKIENQDLPVEIRLSDIQSMGREVTVKDKKETLSSGLVLREYAEIASSYYG